MSLGNILEFGHHYYEERRSGASICPSTLWPLLVFEQFQIGSLFLQEALRLKCVPSIRGGSNFDIVVWHTACLSTSS